MYDVFFCAYETGLVISEGVIFGGDGCSGTDNLRTDAVSETTLGAVAGWVATNIECGVNSYGNEGLGEG